ncbi:N-6 DNA methylase [Streptomyces sp. NPDC002133]|uniref:N-6 DNA methylase n=1 Tax=Streptomyces sp. NPDC002133 TaxID=3154409 RepID=UPI00332983F1
MPKPSAQVTAAEISRLAGVTRATVSNWRRRHADFPAPAGGTDTSPLYDLEAVRAWLDARGHGTAASPSEELRAALRLYTGGGSAATRLLPLVLAAAQRDAAQLTALSKLSDPDLAARSHDAVADLAESVPDAESVTYTPADASLLRALLQCVQEEGGRAALDVLAERELEESAASGAYQTPEPLADLMARLLAPASGPYPARVLDPACGSGTLLAAAARRGATELFAQDSLPVQAQRSAVRLRLAAPDAEISVRAGDSLRADAFPEPTADAVLCNPPYGDRDWGHDELAYDPRWVYGVPPRAESELAWAQHALSHLAPGGLAVMLLPPATAARSSGRRVRAELLRGGALRGVIALPPGAATPFHIGLQLWLLQRPQPDGGDRQTVLFVDLSGDQTTPDRASTRTRAGQAALDWEALTASALECWQAFDADPSGFADHPGIARAVPVIDLLDDLVDLTPARHVRVTPPAADPAQVAKRAEELTERLGRGVAAFADASALGIWQPTDTSREWRTATVADLARGAALSVLRAAPAVRGADDAVLPKEYVGRPVLTASDVATGARASGSHDEQRLAHTVPIEAGDILVPRIVSAHGTRARVADEQDAGCLLGLNVHLFRPDRERLDPWFLAGFLSAEDNVSSASTGSTSIHLDSGRLRVPLLPLAEQRSYGQAFRRLHELRTAAQQAADLAAESAGLLTAGLTSGALLPPDTDSA